MSPSLLRSTKITIAGVGSIGRNIALQLAQMGVGRMVLVDPDTVDAVNLGTQGYSPDQVSLTKVVACSLDAERLNPDCAVHGIDARLPTGQHRPDRWGDVLFLTTDTMSSRRDIMLQLQQTPEEARRVSLVVDVRMLGEVFQVRSLVPTDSNIATYMKDHVFDDSEAVPGTCSTRTTGYGATCAASFAVASFSKMLRGMQTVPLVEVDLFTLDIEKSFTW